MATLSAKKIEGKDKEEKASKVNTPEVRSAIVRIAHKLSANSSKGQVVKIGNKYYRIKELG
ncbi:hypothetical protein FEZ18_05460 [Oceanihabitans sp. IOP_32]|uniref:hypothetical protein n=1 Tax=Oceanihabitans sp. IOP_32 TaxID=2529032 RepID=UPI001292E0EE|nr:hypothetical protein [Oceanihabitans sp. IOP_32]QFZ54273.1 hypothetical protein FEZ18_05460 [Oceanihabitans sp. IOP_32]